MKNIKQRIKFNKTEVIIAIALFLTSFLLTMNYRMYSKLNTQKICIQDKLDVLDANETSNTQLTSNIDNSIQESQEENYKYLSDLDYITTNNWSYNGWAGHTIQKDKNPEGGEIKLIVDGVTRTFSKGMGVHANGQLTYDISALSTKFSRFVASLGVDASRGSKGSIFFQVFVSSDGTSWDSILKTDILTGTSPAYDIDLDVTGYKYLRIYVDQTTDGNGSDHGVLANAKLVTKDYSDTDGLYNKIHKLDYYDNLLKIHDVTYNYNNNYHLVLEREFVRKLGFWNIQDAIQEDSKNLNAIEWILGSDENLEQIIEVGNISNSSLFIEVLSNLYTTYKTSLETQDGYVYQKMMVGLAAAYSSDTLHSPMVFSTQVNDYDYIERFELMKKIYDDNLFGSMYYDKDIKEQYKTYHVELMRMLMQESARNEEILWLNNQSDLKGKDLYNIQYYVKYISPNFNHAEYYDISYKDIYDTKYGLSLYNIPFATDNIKRYWMAMENGGICWNQSRFASSLNRLNGIPSTGFYQPVHEGYFTYSENDQKQGIWDLMNNLSGWGRSSTKWYGGSRYRLLFDWANKSFADQNENASNHGNSAGYLVLAQANLNDYSNYKKSLYYNLIANSYEDEDTKVDTYKKALEIEKLNLDSYDYLIQNYKLLNKSSEEWHTLAQDIIEAYTYYPNAMHDLLKLIKPYLNNVDQLDIDLKENNALELATKATNNEILQPQASKEIANAILGKDYIPFANFNFAKDENGNTIGKIVISDEYTQIDIKYSLDGGNTYSTVFNTGTTSESHTITLSAEEVSRINETDDITIDIVPLRNPVNIFTIDITKATLPDNLYANDLENYLIGATNEMEWRLSENDIWTSYNDALPDLTGNKTLEVRTSYTGAKIASDIVKYNFTEDNQPDTRKYIPISHLSIHNFSSQSTDKNRPFYAPNAIDGNLNTIWHTDFAVNVITKGEKPFLVIKLDQPAYLSALEFIQKKYKANDPDYIKNVTVYVSMDGDSWEEVKKTEDFPKNTELRTVEFNKSIEAQYVKLEMETYDMFASIAMINLFQDTTLNPHPTAGIVYSTEEPINGEVVARLVNFSDDDIVITRPENGSNEYVFTEEGKHEFTFEFYRESDGKTGSATAMVDWIDKTAPTATIKYSPSTATNGTVIATLNASEDVTILNNKEYHVNEENKVVDKDGNILEDYTVDDLGNVKDHNGNVIGNINPCQYEFYENGEFTFEFVDRAGNKGSTTAKVDWIDIESPTATLEYSTHDETSEPVVVTLIPNKDVTVVNNNGSLTYIFTENGEFTFEFKDQAGNIGIAIAKVDWIYKNEKTDESETFNIKTSDNVNSKNNTTTITKTNPNTNTVDKIEDDNNSSKDSLDDQNKKDDDNSKESIETKNVNKNSLKFIPILLSIVSIILIILVLKKMFYFENSEN